MFNVSVARTGAGGSVLPVNHRQHVDSTAGTLTLSAVNRLTDQGLYTCDARDSTGQGMTRSVYVSVMGQPTRLLTCCYILSSCHAVVLLLTVLRRALLRCRMSKQLLST